ncbi:MAG: hypothetical protein Q4A24_02580 [Akkermansia sp.]|nr:hypothetical protein [Akkermansia sp.]
MKRPFSFLAVLALGTAMLQAAPQLYDITLTSAERFTQCRITYETDTLVKFRGTDKTGKEVTKEVKASAILVRKEVEPLVKKVTPKPAKPTAKEEKPEQTDSEPEETTEPEETEDAPETADAPPAEPEETTEPAAEEEEKPAAAPTATGPSSREKTYDVVNARMEKVTKLKEGIASPTRSLTSRFNSTKSTIEKNLAKIEAMCAEVDALQAECDSMKGMGFTFDVVTEQDRAKYAVEGKAAYDAMVMDMNQKKSSRKIGGLDKFEELRNSFQGIPEYKEAYAWYLKTLKALNSKWDKMISKEEARRKKLKGDKKSEADEKDKAEYEKLEAQLEKDGEHIAQVWYTPSARNLLMLSKAKNKVEDALRRSERNKESEYVGKVADLIATFWTTMDRAKDMMVNGEIEEAKALLDEDEDFKQIMRLHPTLLPEEYKKPIREQRGKLYDEIKTRISTRRTALRSLDSKRTALNRLTESTLRQVDTIERMVQDELADQAAAAEEESDTPSEEEETAPAEEEESSEE